MFSSRSKSLKAIVIATLLGCLLLLSFFAGHTSFKRKQIPEAVIRKMDVVIANEIANFDSNTTLCEANIANTNIGRCRHDFFQYLADQGYEVGDIVLNLFDYRTPVFKADLNEYERLHQLAEQGDKSGLCLAYIVLSKIYSHAKTSWPYSIETEFEFAKAGSRQGLPVCEFIESYAYEFGTHGYKKDSELALRIIHNAAIAGLYNAQVALLVHYIENGISDPNDPSLRLKGEYAPADLETVVEEIKRYKPNYILKDLSQVQIAFCWARVADHYRPGNVEIVASRMQRVAYENGLLIHPEYLHMSKQWDLRDIPFEKKPTSPQDCIKMEDGGSSVSRIQHQRIISTALDELSDQMHAP